MRHLHDKLRALEGKGEGGGAEEGLRVKAAERRRGRGE